VADDGVSGYELWTCSNGTASIVKDISPGAQAGVVVTHSPYIIRVMNNKMYFIGYDATHGSEIWESDGTAAGTNLAFDINHGMGIGSAGSYGNRYFEIVNNKLFFAGVDANQAFGLYMSDGTLVGTNFYPGLNDPDNFITYEN